MRETEAIAYARHSRFCYGCRDLMASAPAYREAGALGADAVDDGWQNRMERAAGSAIQAQPQQTSE